MTVEEYCEVVQVELKCTLVRVGRWTCRGSHVEVMHNGGLISEYGQGPTANDSVRDYAKMIAGKKIAIRAMSPDRREFIVPETLS